MSLEECGGMVLRQGPVLNQCQYQRQWIRSQFGGKGLGHQLPKQYWERALTMSLGRGDSKMRSSQEGNLETARRMSSRSLKQLSGSRMGTDERLGMPHVALETPIDNVCTWSADFQSKMVSERRLGIHLGDLCGSEKMTVLELLRQS